MHWYYCLPRFCSGGGGGRQKTGWNVTAKASQVVDWEGQHHPSPSPNHLFFSPSPIFRLFSALLSSRLSRVLSTFCDSKENLETGLGLGKCELRYIYFRFVTITCCQGMQWFFFSLNLFQPGKILCEVVGVVCDSSFPKLVPELTV